MLTRIAILWVIFAGLMGFALGGSFVWSFEPPPQTRQSATSDQEAKNSGSKNNPKTQSLLVPTDSVGLYTLVLAVFTGLLVAVSGFQGYFLLRADGTARIVANAAKAQADIAKKALADIERPYLFIFNVGRLQAEEGIWDEDGAGDLLLSVTYSVANHGKIPAIIKRAQAGLSVAAAPIEPNRVAHSHNLIVSPIFAAGEARPEMIERLVWGGDYGNDEYQDIIPTLGANSSLFFWIIITYRGPFTDGHETRACWIYNESTGRLVRWGDSPEYNSET